MQLHVHEWGAPDAPGVVCLHGVTGHGRRFRKLAEERLTGYRMLAPDLRGHGRSGWEEPWTLAEHVGDLLETFAEPAVWIGHSFGGRLILELTARRPELARGVVLLDPAIHVPPEFAEQYAAQEREEKAYSSAAEAIARWAGLFHTPREILEEEMREHLVADEDGRLRYR
ncbi:MAG: alpha/beta fold hydrolase, partial [Gaiellaceae bacterium]